MNLPAFEDFLEPVGMPTKILPRLGTAFIVRASAKSFMFHRQKI
jgi:hypothetical protein